MTKPQVVHVRKSSPTTLPPPTDLLIQGLAATKFVERAIALTTPKDYHHQQYAFTVEVFILLFQWHANRPGSFEYGFRPSEEKRHFTDLSVLQQTLKRHECIEQEGLSLKQQTEAQNCLNLLRNQFLPEAFRKLQSYDAQVKDPTIILTMEFRKGFRLRHTITEQIGNREWLGLIEKSS